MPSLWRTNRDVHQLFKSPLQSPTSCVRRMRIAVSAMLFRGMHGHRIYTIGLSGNLPFATTSINKERARCSSEHRARFVSYPCVDYRVITRGVLCVEPATRITTVYAPDTSVSIGSSTTFVPLPTVTPLMTATRAPAALTISTTAEPA